jgi:hypothetical protein
MKDFHVIMIFLVWTIKNQSCFIVADVTHVYDLFNLGYIYHSTKINRSYFMVAHITTPSHTYMALFFSLHMGQYENYRIPLILYEYRYMTVPGMGQ